MALVQEYFHLTEKYVSEYGDNTILLMLVGVFYEVYGCKDEFGNYSGSRIVDFSQICELQIAEKKVCISNANSNHKNDSNTNSLVVVMAGFKDMLLEKYLRKLQDAGFTAVVYNQDEKDKKITRSLEGIYSPGTYFSNDSLKLTNNIACIWVDVINYKREKMVVVGMSNIDIYTGKSNIFEYQEKYILNPTTFDELERFISIHEPSECIFISNVPEAEDTIIQFANIKSSLLHKISATTTHSLTHSSTHSSEKEKRVKNCQKQTYQMEILKRFYKDTDKDTDNKDITQRIVDTFIHYAIASQSFCFLLDFIYQHNPYLVHKIHEPCFENCSDRLILANHSLKQLNIIQDTSCDERNVTSVMKILNKCLTPMGKRMFTHQCLNPTTNHVFLQTEYDIVEKVLENNFQTNYVFFSQRGREIKDLSKWERQIILKKMSPKSFCILNKNLQLIMEIIEFVETNQNAFLIEYLQKKGLHISLLKRFSKDMKEYIETHMSLEIAKNIDNVQTFDTNFFNSGIHSELDKTTKIIEESEGKLESIKDYLSNIIKSKENKSSNAIKTNDYVKIHETEKNSYSLVTTVRRCKLLEDALPKTSIHYPLGNNDFPFLVEKDKFYFTKQNATNNFIHEPQINDICKTITNSKNSIKDILAFVYNHFVETFGEKFQASLEKLVSFVTYMDIVYCKAFVSKKNNYCKPVLELDAEKSFVNAKDLRHCLIEHLQHNEFYVTNDISLGYKDCNKDCNEKTKTKTNGNGNEGTDGILLYGTNAVGKTSLIKALGISVIMAQSGLYVPCSQFVFKPYKYIFTRILGNDNIFKGLSTFAVEMSELRTILRLADENSLILGDELCSGTEIVSAISIFVAGICKLHSQKSSYMFATHLHEITKYEEITNITNLKLKHMEVVYDKEKDVLVYHRKLKDGPGNSLYGLEVCKSLSLPNDFLEMANDIRMKYNPDTGSSILSLKTSHYNSKKIVGLCEKCGIKMSKEVHHLTHQSQSDADGYILVHGYKVHKNRLANLMSLCESCHDDFHRINENKKQIKVKTSNLNYMH